MIRHRRVLAAALAAVVLTGTAAAAQEQAGVNAALRNSVQTRPAGQQGLRPAVLRAPVRMGDYFVSGPQATLQILLRDRTTMTIGSNARVTIDRFVFRGGPAAGASVAQGAFRFASGRGAGPRGGVNTPVASIGVRGTIVEVLVGPEVAAILAGLAGLPSPDGSPDTLSLIVLRGPGANGSGLDLPGAIDVTGPGGSEVSIERAGMAVLVTDTGIYGPFPLPDALSARLAALLGPEPDNGTDTGNGDILSAALIAGEGPGFSDSLPAPGSPLQAVESTTCTVEPALGGGSPGQGDPVVIGGGCTVLRQQ